MDWTTLAQILVTWIGFMIVPVIGALLLEGDIKEGFVVLTTVFGILIATGVTLVLVGL